MTLKARKSLPKGGRRARITPALVGLSLSLLLGAGCAHQQPAQQEAQLQQQENVERLRARLEEVERTNGRLNVRIEELEEQIFLLQDMAESNRIALRRRGYMQRGGYLDRPETRAEAPQPAPESYYGAGSPYGAQSDSDERARDEERRRTRRNVTRIPLSSAQGGEQPSQPEPQTYQDSQAPQAEQNGDEEEIVITEEEFRAFAGQPRSSSGSSSRGSSGSTSKRTAQPPVTNEKLNTSDADGSSSAGSQPSPDVDNPLELYKAGLSDYRSGDYAEALGQFRAFLASKPNPNYIDNALYWIGECHYGLGDYEQATTFFERVLREQPDGNKVPDAMLKMSLAFERMGSPEKARGLLEKLAERYPTTNAGRLGAQKLSELSE